MSIRELVTRIAQLTGFMGRIEWDTTEPSGQPRRCLDVTKARERFGFMATTPFETCLRRTIAWYESTRPTM